MTTLDKLNKIYNINFFSIFLITQKLLRLLKKGSSPSIINISSSASIENNIGRFAYSSSKVLINSFTKTLSKEAGRYKIRVNAVAPGLTNTKMMKSTTTEKNINETIKRISLLRVCEPEEIANLVLFLGSNVSSYINGQVISIDGGLNEGL
jgi:3-oxoacyl-[acyl-carrier protein] reductase